MITPLLTLVITYGILVLGGKVICDLRPVGLHPFKGNYMKLRRSKRLFDRQTPALQPEGCPTASNAPLEALQAENEALKQQNKHLIDIIHRIDDRARRIKGIIRLMSDVLKPTGMSVEAEVAKLRPRQTDQRFGGLRKAQ